MFTGYKCYLYKIVRYIWFIFARFLWNYIVSVVFVNSSVFCIFTIRCFNWKIPFFKSISFLNVKLWSNVLRINSFFLYYPNFCIGTCFNRSLFSWVKSNFYIVFIFWIFCYDNLLILSIVNSLFTVRIFYYRFKFNKFPASICCNCWWSYINWSIF